MSKTLILGDTHGRGIWQLIVQKENPDRVIFLGDYWDSLEISYSDQLYNFQRIIDFTRTSGKEVILLIGNHDIHYQQWAMEDDGETTSGFQDNYAVFIQEELEKNKDLFRIAYKLDNFLFSHAGISKTWLELMEIPNDASMVDVVNDYLKYKPRVFGFRGLNIEKYHDSFGDNIWQGPLWIRPRSLMKEYLGYTQVVGHTIQNCIDFKGKSTGGKYYFVDTLGTSGEYLMIESGKLKLGKI